MTEEELKQELRNAGFGENSAEHIAGVAVQGRNSSLRGAASLQAGYTQILSGVERFLPAAAAVAATIANQTALSAVSITSYSHPVQGEPVCAHADAHDAFILQIQGCRVWRHWHPSLQAGQLVEQPAELENSTCLTDGLDSASRRLELQAGSLLRLPGGIAHQTSSCGRGPSTHWAITATPTNAARVLLDVAQARHKTDIHAKILAELEKNSDLSKRLRRGLHLPSRASKQRMTRMQLDGVADALLALLDEAIPGPWPALDRKSVSARLQEVLQRLDCTSHFCSLLAQSATREPS